MAEGSLKVTAEKKFASSDENRKEPGARDSAAKGWTLKKVLPLLVLLVTVVTAVGGLFIHIGHQTARLDTKINDHTTRLDTKIHEESKQIRKLVGENTNKLNVLEERLSNVKATTEKIDHKLDRLLMERKKTQLVE